MLVELINEENRSANHTNIEVIGVGGGGCNAVNRMLELGIDGVGFAAVNTDLQALELAKAPRKMALGKRTTGGLGAGGNPEVGKEAAEEDREVIKEYLSKAHMVFITAGMGGGTGTGAAPIIAQIAKEVGALTVGVVTTPFRFEGVRKKQLAKEGIDELRKFVDTMIVIPNEELMKITTENTPIKETFLKADDVLRMGVKGISDLITKPGEINVDFNDVKTIMTDGGEALMGIGYGQDENRAFTAAEEALNNPLLNDADITGATGVLVQITGDERFSLDEYGQIMETINEHVDAEKAIVISGMAVDPLMSGEIKVTLIATGFHKHKEGKETAKENTSLNKERPQKRVIESSTLAAKKKAMEKNNLENFLSLDEFAGMQAPLYPQKRAEGQSVFPFDADQQEDELFIPTVLRQRRNANVGMA